MGKKQPAVSAHARATLEETAKRIRDLAIAQIDAFNWDTFVKQCVAFGIDFPSDLLRKKAKKALDEGDLDRATVALGFLGEKPTPTQMIACGKKKFLQGYIDEGREFFGRANATPSRPLQIACARFLMQRNASDDKRYALALLEPLKARSLLLQLAGQCRNNHCGESYIRIRALAAAGAKKELRNYARELEGLSHSQAEACDALVILKDKKLLTTFAERMLQERHFDTARTALLATGYAGKRRLLKIARELLEEGDHWEAMKIYEKLRKKPSDRSLTRCFDCWLRAERTHQKSVELMIEFFKRTADVNRLVQLGDLLGRGEGNEATSLSAYVAAQKCLK